MEEITLLSFLGIYVLVLGIFFYNFYLSKKMYRLLENIGEVLALSMDHDRTVEKSTPKEGTLKRLIREGMEIERGIEE